MATTLQLNTKKFTGSIAISNNNILLLATNDTKEEATRLSGLAWFHNAFWMLFGTQSTYKLALDLIFQQIHSNEEQKTPTKVLIKLHEISKLALKPKEFLESIVFTRSSPGLFSHSNNLEDYRISIRGSIFDGSFLIADSQQLKFLIKEDGKLTSRLIDALIDSTKSIPNIIKDLTFSIPTNYDDIISYIKNIREEKWHNFYLSESIKDSETVIPDRAWSLQYGGQSFYTPSGKADFNRHGIKFHQFLELSDIEKIQIFQLKGMMTTPFSFIKTKLISDICDKMESKEITADEEDDFMYNLYNTDYIPFYREFAIQHFAVIKNNLKNHALLQLKSILKNLHELKSTILIRQEDLQSKDSKTEEFKKLHEKLKLDKVNCGIQNYEEDLKVEDIEDRIMVINNSINEINNDKVDYKLSDKILSLFMKIIS